MIQDSIRVFVFLLGLLVVIFTLSSEIKTFVLPRSAPDPVTTMVFTAIRRIFTWRLHWTKTYEARDRVMAYFAPIALLMLVPVWLILIFLGYCGMYWAVQSGVWDGQNWYQAFRLSGSSLFTLGFEPLTNIFSTSLAFSEAAIGLILVALLIAYLPSMYAAFSRREAAVTLLEVRAGSPPSAAGMILRFHRIHGFEALNEQWRTWEVWFADIEESHTSLPALVFFRSPQPNHSWVTAAGAVLDTAALTLSAIDIPYDPQAALCIRAGFLALRRISDFFGVPYNNDPKPDDPISIRREEFDEVINLLKEKNIPIKADLDQAWIDYSGWRVNYDRVLISLADLTMAPMAPWSSDRIKGINYFPPIWRNK